MNLKHGALTTDGEALIYEIDVRPRMAVILHGAGKAERKRYYALAEELQRRDMGVLLFDFSGHGESTGRLDELSLARRVRQARAMIDQLVPNDTELYLIGFSMSGQTACDLLPIYGERIKAVLLACPAAYRADVQDMAFGEEEFTVKIREENSWQTSNSPHYLKNFSGKTVIAIGTDDDVIPRGVIDMLGASARELAYCEFADVGHNLAMWLAGHPHDQAVLIDELIA